MHTFASKMFHVLFLQAAIRDRNMLDRSRVQTMVYNQPSRISGQITAVDVFARKSGRLLKLGVYRPEGNSVCRFKLVKEYIVTSVPVGRSTVKRTEHNTNDVTIYPCLNRPRPISHRIENNETCRYHGPSSHKAVGRGPKGKRHPPLPPLPVTRLDPSFQFSVLRIASLGALLH